MVMLSPPDMATTTSQAVEGRVALWSPFSHYFFSSFSCSVSRTVLMLLLFFVFKGELKWKMQDGLKM